MVARPSMRFSYMLIERNVRNSIGKVRKEFVMLAAVHVTVRKQTKNQK